MQTQYKLAERAVLMRKSEEANANMHSSTSPRRGNYWLKVKLKWISKFVYAKRRERTL